MLIRSSTTRFPACPPWPAAPCGRRGWRGLTASWGSVTGWGLRVLTLQDGDYPERLREIPDPPAVLYIRGTLFHFDQEAAIGIVGAREPSPYGEKVAAQLGLELARNGVLLVSGIAQGIDSIALKGALQGGGRVVSVLGGGVDVPYPWQNRYLYEDVAAAGGGSSASIPRGRGTTGSTFPSATDHQRPGPGRGGGGVRPAQRHHADRQPRHGAEPGRVRHSGQHRCSMSEGPNWLLRQGARPVTSAQDILEEYVDPLPGKALQGGSSVPGGCPAAAGADQTPGRSGRSPPPRRR